MGHEVLGVKQRNQKQGGQLLLAPAPHEAAPGPPCCTTPDKLPPVPAKVALKGAPVYRVEDLLGEGGFGQVWRGKRAWAKKPDPSKPDEVAIKFESLPPAEPTPAGGSPPRREPPHEWAVYGAIGRCQGIPRLYHAGECEGFNIMVMDLLGPSLWDLWSQTYRTKCKLPPSYVASVGTQALAVLKGLHAKGWVHGDVKPENMLVGPRGSPSGERLHLVDLGLASRWAGPSGAPLKYGQQPDDFRGTMRYASVHAHLGRAPSRRDDLESLAYSLLYLLAGGLPWQGFQGDFKGYHVARSKMGLSIEELCKGVHSTFRVFTEVVTSMGFLERPPYEALTELLQPLARECFSLQSPLLALPRPQPLGKAYGRKALSLEVVGAKRRREEGDPQGDPPIPPALQGARPAKRLRGGHHTSEWVSVYQDQPGPKQWVAQGVPTGEVGRRVQAAWAKGGTVRLVAACGPLWSLVFEPSPASASRQEVHFAGALDKMEAWISEQWAQGRHITALAGNTQGEALVIMAQGTSLTGQTLHRSRVFPYGLVKEYWEKGYFITAVAALGCKPYRPGRLQDEAGAEEAHLAEARWAVVMSAGAPIRRQALELDFQYPSEGIHQRWGEGYRISCCGANADQCVVVLSKGFGPEGEAAAETTYRTQDFPGPALGGGWQLVGLCYGRTIA